MPGKPSGGGLDSGGPLLWLSSLISPHPTCVAGTFRVTFLQLMWYVKVQALQGEMDKVPGKGALEVVEDPQAGLPQLTFPFSEGIRRIDAGYRSLDSTATSLSWWRRFPRSWGPPGRGV